MAFKYGRIPSPHDLRTLKLEHYLSPAALPLVPPTFDYGGLVSDFPMYDNDRIGDCTAAAMAHMFQIWNASGKGTFYAEPSIESVEALYTATSGWPAKGDNGANELDVLRYVRSTGLTPDDKLYAFASVDRHDREYVRAAAYIFGGLYIGIGIADTDQFEREFSAGRPWTPEWGDIKAGHAVNITGITAKGLSCISWGRKQTMNWAFWEQQVEEVWACLPAVWANNRAPIVGLNFDELAADLSKVGQLVT